MEPAVPRASAQEMLGYMDDRAGTTGSESRERANADGEITSMFVAAEVSGNWAGRAAPLRHEKPPSDFAKRILRQATRYISDVLHRLDAPG
jgi:hypothetical protein